MKKTTIRPLRLETRDCPMHDGGVRVEGELVEVYDAEPHSSSSVGYMRAFADEWDRAFGARR